LALSDSRLHAIPSIFNRKSPVEIAENIGREYFSAFQRLPGGTRSIRIIVKNRFAL